MLAIFLVLVYLVNATLSTQKTKFNELGPLQTKWLAKKPDMNWHRWMKAFSLTEMPCKVPYWQKTGRGGGGNIYIYNVAKSI